jgi:integrase
MNTKKPGIRAARAPQLPTEITLATAPIESLDPARLTPLAADAIDALLAEGESANTVRSYQGALRYWSAWFSLRYGRAIALPVPTPVALQFIVDHVNRTTEDGLRSELPAAIDAALVDAGLKGKLGSLAMATVSHRLSVLSKVHQIKALPNPCRDPQVQELLSKARRAYAKRGVTQDKKPALTREPLEALLETCDDSLRGIRDRALLLFAWASGGRRRSEVTAATRENVTKVGERAYVFALAYSKTNQTGTDRPDNDKPIVGVAAAALEAWLAASGIRSGAIFRRIRRGNKLGEPLFSAAVRDIVKQRALLAGIPGDFSAHSLRSGFVTEAARQGVPLGETMAMTGHASVPTVLGYFRTGSRLESTAAKLMDRKPPV